MLLINVHQFDIIFTQPVSLCALEDEVDDIGSIFGLESQDIIILGGSEDFGQGREVDAKCKVSIAAERGEPFGFQHHGHEGDMRVVHRLESDPGVIAVEVAVLHQVFDSIDHLYTLSEKM